MGKMHSISFGTSGWSYDDWVGPFYPPGTQPADYLTEYSKHFDLVEVDSSFHQPPSAETIDDWRQSTPRKFLFTLSVPQRITHEKILLGCRDDFREFVNVVKALGNKLACVLFQFGYFGKQVFPNVREFLDRLDRFLDGAGEDVPVAVEICNKTWLSPEWFDLLRRHKAATVLLDHPWMPRIADVVERFDVQTGRLVYVRLVGNREAIEKKTKRWDKAVVDRSSDTSDLAPVLLQLAEHSDVLVLAGNHYSGHAPAVLADLATVIGRVGTIAQ